MQAPKSFKYSPNGFTVLQVAKGEEMCESAIKAAIDLKIITKAAVAKANKSKDAQAKAAQEAAEVEAKAAQEAAEAKAKLTASDDEASGD